VDFTNFEAAIVDRLKALPELANVRVEAWPDGADTEGLVVNNSSVFVRFKGFPVEASPMGGRRKPIRVGQVTFEIQMITKRLRGPEGSYRLAPVIAGALNGWPDASTNLVESPVELSQQGLEMTDYQFIKELDRLWNWGLEFSINAMYVS
jgi:hypothetical protein